MAVEQNGDSLSGAYVYSGLLRFPPRPAQYAKLLPNKMSPLQSIASVPIAPTCTWGWSQQWHFQFLAGLVGPCSLTGDMRFWTRRTF